MAEPRGCGKARRPPGPRDPAAAGRLVRGRAGPRAVAPLALAALLCLGCYGFSGGGGLPSHIRTAYVEPVANESPRFGLSELLNERLLGAVRQRLGLQLASEGEADAIIRATIRQYSDNAVDFQAREGVGADVFLRRVTIGARVEIFDVVQDAVVWEAPSVTGVGEYEPESQTEEAALEIAMENLVQRIVDGAQSQW